MTVQTNTCGPVFGYWYANGREGDGYLYKGHSVSDEQIRAEVDGEWDAEKVYLCRVPRVKWCEKYGFACDSAGEWHAHYYAVMPHEDYAHTIIFPRSET